MGLFKNDFDLPTFSKTGGTKKQLITLFLKPNNEKEYYRFRLLFYTPPNGRDYPFIKRWVHTHWGKTEKGQNIVDDTVVCLMTNYVDFEGNSAARREACPMCRHDNENFGIWKNSGWKDKIAMKKHFAMQRQFQGIVPVYVVQDPNNDKNNGKLKCFIFNNPDEFDAFDKLVHEKIAEFKREGDGKMIFNGVNAVDFYLRMEKVPEVRNEGKPNETTVEVRKITRMLFGKKPYDIPEINEDAIRNFEFDAQYYTQNTIGEIEEFYRKYYSVPTQNVPNEDIDFLTDDPEPVKEKPKASPEGKEILKKGVVETDVDVDAEDLLSPEEEKEVSFETGDGLPNVGISDIEDEPKKDISGDEIDSLMAELRKND